VRAGQCEARAHFRERQLHGMQEMPVPQQFLSSMFETREIGSTLALVATRAKSARAWTPSRQFWQ